MKNFLGKLLIHTIMLIIYVTIYKLNGFETTVITALANILATLIIKEDS